MTQLGSTPDARTTAHRRHTPGHGPEPHAGPIAAIPCALLRGAAERVAATFPADTGEPPGEVRPRDLVALLARAAYELRTARGPGSLAAAATPLGRRMLDLLRAALLEHAGESHAAGGPDLLIQTLKAIESVRELIEPRSVDHLAAHLSGPDAVELLVEVAHDLRSPLTSILFLAETLQRGQSGGVNDLQHRQLGLIYGAAFGLSTLASDLIELARGGDRLVEHHAAPLSVAETFESVRDIVRPLAEEKRLTIRLLPPPTDHRMGHSLALGRVLLNLTTNALKFTEEGFVELVARETGPTTVEFSVRDTGKGINPDVLDSLYAAFRRAPGRGGFAFSGTGLGLTICRRLVHAMGSDLRVESRAGWGTRFFFDLKLPPVATPSEA